MKDFGDERSMPALGDFPYLLRTTKMEEDRTRARTSSRVRNLQRECRCDRKSGYCRDKSTEQ